MIGIYKIINKVNGKLYIGQSIDIKDRWEQHRYKAFNSKEVAYNSAIHQAFRKYGMEAFEFEVIEECLKEELDEKERYWIAFYNSLSPNGYNITPGGQKGKASKRATHCLKCGKEIGRDNKTGLCLSCVQTKVFLDKEELYQRLVEYQGNFTKVASLYGLTDNAIRKKCKNFGLPHLSSDYKNLKQKKQSKRPVAKLDKETGEVLETFESIADAARSLGLKKGNHITEACQGKLKVVCGFCWTYL